MRIISPNLNTHWESNIIKKNLKKQTSIKSIEKTYFETIR